MAAKNTRGSVCPTCKGSLELQVSADNTPQYRCMGTCGTVWSAFDLALAAR